MWHFSCLALDPSLSMNVRLSPHPVPLEIPLARSARPVTTNGFVCWKPRHGCGIFKFHTGISSFLVGWCTARPILCINYGVGKLSAASSGFGGHAEAEAE